MEKRNTDDSPQISQLRSKVSKAQIHLFNVRTNQYELYQQQQYSNEYGGDNHQIIKSVLPIWEQLEKCLEKHPTFVKNCSLWTAANVCILGILSGSDATWVVRHLNQFIINRFRSLKISYPSKDQQPNRRSFIYQAVSFALQHSMQCIKENEQFELSFELKSFINIENRIEQLKKALLCDKREQSLSIFKAVINEKMERRQRMIDEFKEKQKQKQAQQINNMQQLEITLKNFEQNNQQLCQQSVEENDSDELIYGDQNARIVQQCIYFLARLTSENCKYFKAPIRIRKVLMYECAAMNISVRAILSGGSPKEVENELNRLYDLDDSSLIIKTSKSNGQPNQNSFTYNAIQSILIDQMLHVQRNEQYRSTIDIRALKLIQFGIVRRCEIRKVNMKEFQFALKILSDGFVEKQMNGQTHYGILSLDREGRDCLTIYNDQQEVTLGQCSHRLQSVNSYSIIKYGYAIQAHYDGELYDGECCRGNSEGQGTLMLKDGTEICGYWRGYDCYGSIEYPNGEIVKGKIGYNGSMWKVYV